MCPVCRMLAGKPASILQTRHIQNLVFFYFFSICVVKFYIRERVLLKSETNN